MHFFHFMSIYSIGVGFGFAFTVRSFQDQIRDLFARKDIVGQSISKIETHLGAWYKNFREKDIKAIETADGDEISTSEIINDAIEELHSLADEKDEIVSKYYQWKTRKEFTFNFKTISLISAVYCFALLVISGIMRNPSFSKSLPMVYDGVFYMEMTLLVIIVFFFIRDLFVGLKQVLLRRTFIFIGFLLIFITVLVLQHNIRNHWTDGWWVIIMSFTVPFIHYILYFFRTIAYSPMIDRDFVRRLDDLIDSADDIGFDRARQLREGEKLLTIKTKPIKVRKAKCPVCGTVHAIRSNSPKGQIELSCKSMDCRYHFNFSWP